MASTANAKAEYSAKILHANDLEIGETAGRVWHALTDQGPQSVASLMDSVGAPESLFYMALGWLAREDKVEFESDGGDYLVRLK